MLLTQMVDGSQHFGAADQPSLKLPFARKIHQHYSQQDRQESRSRYSRHCEYEADCNNGNSNDVFDYQTCPAKNRVSIDPKLIGTALRKVRRRQPDQHRPYDSDANDRQSNE
jgi:hypothetical protein